jgi:hypothetical protein
VGQLILFPAHEAIACAWPSSGTRRRHHGARLSSALRLCFLYSIAGAWTRSRVFHSAHARTLALSAVWGLRVSLMSSKHRAGDSLRRVHGRVQRSARGSRIPLRDLGWCWPGLFSCRTLGSLPTAGDYCIAPPGRIPEKCAVRSSEGATVIDAILFTIGKLLAQKP